MKKRTVKIVFSMTLILSLISLSRGFDNNANRVNPSDPNDKRQREYTRENATKPIGQGGYYGGHDTLTSEGILLKKEVHKNDADGGTKFNTFANESIPNLRTGAHDEDSTKKLDISVPPWKPDPPIGPNGWGDFFDHFYNPETEKGIRLPGAQPATKRAADYLKQIIQKTRCGPEAISKLSLTDRQKVYDYFGRIEHLIEDMGVPSHTKDDIHVATEPFEKYVNDHWDEIVNSNAFKDNVTVESYLKGQYGVDNNLDPTEYMKALAEKSKKYYSQEELYDYSINPDTGQISEQVNTERLMKNVNELVPEAIKYAAGFINAIYQHMNRTDPGGVDPSLLEICKRPPDPPGPSNDHPDDRFDVSDEFYWEKEIGLTVADLTELYLRTAIKKGMIGVWYGKRFREIFIEGRTTHKDAPQETKEAIETEFQAVKKKLEQRGDEVESDWKGAPDVALFANGFYNSSISLMLKIGEPVSFQRVDFDPAIVRDHPVMLVPTGGFYGLKNSTTVKALLDEYVKSGGTLVLFTQQHGYDWDLLPVPINPETGERRPVMGYGYQEDQSCQFNSVYIDTYHPVLSAFSTSTANIGADGYFSSYPDNSTVLLRRVANGQPAMIMYPYGSGHVIATTMYTDFAFTHNQTNQTEINFVQNIISWVKKPEDILDVRPGQAVNLNINVSNFMDMGAASIKFTILDPSRKVIGEQTQGISLPAAQSAAIPATYTTTSSSVLGIYHIDYILYDSSGTIIQPQAETDSGRFAVSNPPGTAYQPSKTYQLWVTSPAEYVFKGTGVAFTIHIRNNTSETLQGAKLGVGSHEARTEGGRWWIFHEAIEGINIPAGGQIDIPWTFRIDISQSIFFGLFRNIDNPNTYLVTGGLAWAEKGIRLIKPSLNVTLQTDKAIYAKGDDVVINTSLKNNITYNWQPTIKVSIIDSRNTQVFEDVKIVDLVSNGTLPIISNFTLSSTLTTGSYTVSVEAWYGSSFISSSYARFEIPQSQVSVAVNLPSSFNAGANTLPFTITNAGKINVNSGSIDLSLKAPDGGIAYSGNQPFSLLAGETKTLDIPISIPSLKLGYYTLTYSQSDETRTGNPTNNIIRNSVYISPSFDKPSFRVREAANLKLDLKNTGKFNLDNVSITVSALDANYTDTQIISLGVNSDPTSLNFTIPIPETISAGLHNVDMLLILPGGASIPWHVGFVVAEPALSIKYQGVPTASAGDTLSVVVENTGGIDTQYDSYVYLFDYMGFWMETNTGTGLIQAATQGNITYTLPDQLLGGGYTIRVDVIDKKTNKNIFQNIPIGVEGLSETLSVRTDKEIYFSNEEITTLSTVVNQGRAMVDGNLHLEIACSEYAEAPEPVSFHILTQENHVWTERGVLHFPGSYEQQEFPLPITPDQWGGAYTRIRHEGAQSAYLDYIALKDSDGNIYPPYFVGAPEQTDITSEAEGIDEVAAWVTGQTFYAFWENLPWGTSYTLLMVAKEGCGIVWDTDATINQGTGITETLNIPALSGYPGKFYLRGELTNSLGQSLGASSYPFYIIDGNTILLLNTDKRIYKPGETVTITGRIENRAPITAENLILTLTSSQGGQNPQVLLIETINLLSGGNYPFTITTTAEGEEGVVTLSGAVKQNDEILVRITDQYEVANPLVSPYVDMPVAAGNEPFTIEVNLWNDGKVDATVQFGVQSSELVDSQTITIPPGEMRILQYSQQISKNTSYTFTFTGDYQETITHTVSYSLGTSIQVGAGGSGLGVFPEGNVAIPATITNTGQSTETLEVTYQLNPGAGQQSKTYSLPVGGSTTDTLYFNLMEGDYQISATSQKPDASAQASLSVRKENQVQMEVSLGVQANGLVPVDVNLANGGFNEINGTVSLSVTTESGQVVWSGEEALSQLYPQNSQLLTLDINPSAIDPGSYTVQVTLLSNSNQLISTQSLTIGVQGATFQVTQLPSYQTFPAGQEATFTFMVKNIGNQEGSFDLRFKAYDLIDSTRREWLKPNEEKAVTFGFVLPEDLEEKDYFATYEFNAQSSKVTGVSGGQIKYHLAGISLNVNASLDKSFYTEGETAHLTVNIQSPNSNSQNLFARANYAGYEPQQTFTLSGNQVLIFDIPLPKITGEKLFYGIYHEGGRSIHLNSVYIHKAGDVITITTNKQVYNPGETVSVSVSGNASGDMTLTGPGGYLETFAFTGSITKIFNLPSSMAAGTYFINLQLITQNSSLITTVYPFDVAGVQVKMLECQNDKSKYASSDTIATRFTVSSNTAMPAILKAWIVDPTGQYAIVGEQSITLSSSESSLITYNSALSTSVSGIHRLVYGLYGPEDLLLCSGSEAFDVGDAVLLGISTDKVDYPQGNESVVVRAGLYGSVTASLEFYLDGQSEGSQSASLNGFSTLNYILPSVTPGPHTLKVVLTAGGLTSTKETTFAYGSGLPDLTLRLTWDQVVGQSSLNFTLTAINQGKSTSGPTMLTLYDGGISGGKLLSTFDIPTLSQRQSQTLTYEFNLLGRAGANTFSGVIDPSNIVYEFNESNNGDQITFAVPEVTLSTTLEKDEYFTGETVLITSFITNLSKDPLAGLVLFTEAKDHADVQVFTTTQNIPPIEAMVPASFLTNWPTDPNLPEGVYTIHQSILGKGIHTQKNLTFILSKDFTISTDTKIKKIAVGEAAEYQLQLISLKAFKGEIHLSLSGYPQNSTAYFTPNPVTITEGQAQSILTVIPPNQTEAGSYSMKVNATGGGISHDLDLSLNVTDFEMILHPTSQTSPQLEKANYTIILNPLNEFDQGVTLEVNDIPLGMRASLSAKEVVLPQSLTLTLETSKWLLPGEYRIPIVARARTVTHALTAILIVHRNPLIVPGIVTVPGLLNKPNIHTFNLNGGLLSEFQVAEGGVGVNISAGDVDGDGVDEVITATGWKLMKPGRLEVFRRDGTQVAFMQTEQGYVTDLTVAAGDFDGDWVEEVVLGFFISSLSDPLHGGGGVKVYKVMGNRFIDTGLFIQPYKDAGYFGPPNLTVSDVDGDGVPELITAPGPDPSAPAKIKVFKIDTSAGVGQWKLGSQIMGFTVPFNVDGFGARVAAGDLDGDDCAEILVGAGPDLRKKAEVVIVYHRNGGYQFGRFTAYQGLLFGVNIAAIDVDGDGISEILTGPGPDLRSKSKVRIFQRDGTLIKEFQAYPDNIRFGVKVSTGRIGE